MRENDLYKEVSKLAMPDFDKTKQNIVSSETKKFPIKSVVAVAACLVAAVGAVALSQNFRNTPTQNLADQNAVLAPSSDETLPATNPALNSEPDFNDKIVYNKIKGLVSASLACRGETKDYVPGIFSPISEVIPDDMNDRYYNEMYVLPEELRGTEAIQDIENYTELHTCQIGYYKPDSARNIIISFSAKGEPLRDCIIECGKKVSSISGVDVILNGDVSEEYGMCIAVFSLEINGKTVWFDIEASEVTQQEMLSAVRAVISMAKSSSLFLNVCENSVTEPPEGAQTEDFSESHITTEAPVTSQGNAVDIDDEDELNRPDDVLTAPAYDPSVDMP
ncbi:MAG: hypothetical protein ACI4VI_01300 [Acutalibacteraceae bacterium]